MMETSDDSTNPRIRADALQVLEYILRLELAPARWARVAGIIEAAIAATTAGDLNGLRHATAELKLTSPVRVLRIGGTPTGPPPPPLRERLLMLKQQLREALHDGPDGDGDENRAPEPG